VWRPAFVAPAPADRFEPLVRVAPSVIAVISATAAALVALIVFGAIRSRRIGLGVGSGVHVFAGAFGEVRAPLSPIGSVIAAGEEWSAKTADGRSLDR